MAPEQIAPAPHRPMLFQRTLRASATPDGSPAEAVCARPGWARALRYFPGWELSRKLEVIRLSLAYLYTRNDVVCCADLGGVGRSGHSWKRTIMSDTTPTGFSQCVRTRE